MLCEVVIMKDAIKKNKWITLLCIIGAVYFFLAFITPLLTPILLAFLFVTMSGPLLKKLQVKCRIPRHVSVVILLILVVAVVALLVWLLVLWATTSAPGWSQYLSDWEAELDLIMENICNWISRTFRVDVSGVEEAVDQISSQLLGHLQTNGVSDLVENGIRYLRGMVSGGAFLLTFLIGIILLAKDYDGYMNFLLEQQEYHVWLEALCGTVKYIGSFFKAQLIIMGVISGVISAALFLMGIRNGILWGILAGVLDVLPFIGTGIVLIPLIVIQLAQGAYIKALLCGALYGGCVLIREFLEPKILGKTMGVWPVAVLTSLYVGIQLFGLAGVVKGPLGFVLIYQIYQSLMA